MSHPTLKHDLRSVNIASGSNNGLHGKIFLNHPLCVVEIDEISLNSLGSSYVKQVKIIADCQFIKAAAPDEKEGMPLFDHYQAWQAIINDPNIEDDQFVIFYELHYFFDVNLIATINQILEFASSNNNIQLVDFNGYRINYNEDQDGNSINFTSSVGNIKLNYGLLGYFAYGPYLYAVKKSALAQLVNSFTANSKMPIHEFSFGISLDKILFTKLESAIFPVNDLKENAEYRKYNGDKSLNDDLIAQLVKDYQDNKGLRAGLKSSAKYPDLMDKSCNIKSFVITLKETPERYQSFLNKNPTGDKITKFEGCYGKNYSFEELQSLYDFDKAEQLYSRKITKGEVGCTLSHYQLYQHIVDDPEIKEDDFVLICEDDALLQFDWIDRVNYLMEKIKYLTHIDLINANHFKIYTHNPYPNRFLFKENMLFNILKSNKPVIKIGNGLGLNVIYGIDTSCSYCYLIRKSSCRRAISQKPYWVADHFVLFNKIYQTLYVNPLLAIVDYNLESLIDEERKESVKEVLNDPKQSNKNIYSLSFQYYDPAMIGILENLQYDLVVKGLKLQKLEQQN